MCVVHIGNRVAFFCFFFWICADERFPIYLFIYLLLISSHNYYFITLINLGHAWMEISSRIVPFIIFVCDMNAYSKMMISFVQEFFVPLFVFFCHKINSNEDDNDDKVLHVCLKPIGGLGKYCYNGISSWLMDYCSYEVYFVVVCVCVCIIIRIKHINNSQVVKLWMKIIKNKNMSHHY